jgi:hypothetical protein
MTKMKRTIIFCSHCNYSFDNRFVAVLGINKVDQPFYVGIGIKIQSKKIFRLLVFPFLEVKM